LLLVSDSPDETLREREEFLIDPSFHSGWHQKWGAGGGR